MKFKITLIFLIVIITPIFCKAEDLFEYFFYSPRYTNKLDLNLLKELKQEIRIFDDNLGEIYLWLDNPNLPNKIEIRLLDGDHILFNRIFEVPSIKGGLWGHKFSFNLGNNIKIESGKSYYLSIKNLTDDSIYVYYTNKIQLLQTTEEKSIIPITLGKFYIDDKELLYSLKIAFAEYREKDIPIIIDSLLEIEDPYKVNILFNANEPVKYKLIYWDVNRNESYLTSQIQYEESCFIEIKKCKITIYTNPNSFYKFQLSIIDYWGNFRTYEGEFITPPDPTISTSTTSTTTIIIYDKLPPKIFNIQIKELTFNNIIVSFQTDEFAISTLKIFYKETGVIVMEIRNGMFNLYHEISAMNLLFPDLEYEAIIYLEDIFKNKTDYKFSFRTQKGQSDQLLNEFLSKPKLIQINAINQENNKELETAEVQVDYNQNFNKLIIKTANENLKINLIKRSEDSIFRYSIKEGGYELDLNILSPGVYNYLVYQELNPNVKRVLQFGDIEIKNTEKSQKVYEQKEIIDKEISNNKSNNKSIQKPLQIATQSIPTKKTLFSKKSMLIGGIIIILILLFILFLMKRK